MMTSTFSKNTGIKNMVLNAIFLSLVIAISFISQELRAQSGQALSAQELEKSISNQFQNRSKIMLKLAK